eukprot:361200-Chlamydomonas_euryale.AAC.7
MICSCLDASAAHHKLTDESRTAPLSGSSPYATAARTTASGITDDSSSSERPCGSTISVGSPERRTLPPPRRSRSCSRARAPPPPPPPPSPPPFTPPNSFACASSASLNVELRRSCAPPAAPSVATARTEPSSSIRLISAVASTSGARRGAMAASASVMFAARSALR